MKEFVSQTGGRYTYIDDIMNLQELSLAFSNIFDGCGNFIISGCQVSGTTIKPGFVFINGKVRYCSGTTGASKFPMYIYENNRSEKVSYVDSLDKAGREIYECALSNVVPAVNDPITGELPKFIKIEQNGYAPNLEDAFFGKYALLLNTPHDSQTVNKPVNFNDEINTSKSINAKSNVNFIRGNSKGSIFYDDDGSFVFQSKTTSNIPCKIVITDSCELRYYVNDTLVFSTNENGNYMKNVISSEKLKGGNIVVSGSDIYNEGNGSDNAALNINMIGSNGGYQFFRTINIGDGKNNVLVSINGKSRTTDIFSRTSIKSSGITLSLIHDTLVHSDNTLTNYISWKDKNNYEMAICGYTNVSNKDLYLDNKIGNIVVSSDTYITKNLYVKGKNIENVFVSNDDFNNKLKDKVDASSVYEKTDADSTFIKKTDSISVFVDKAGGGDSGKNIVCESIGACTKKEFKDAVLQSNGFNDIVSYGLPGTEDPYYNIKLEARQRALCNTIGAAYKKDVAKEQKDTGWIPVEIKNCGIITKIYVRQIGHIVSIQGEVHTHHDGVIFTLPNNVDAPKYKIGYSHNKAGEWHCIIEGGKKDCVVDYCNSGCSEYIGFLMTYIV